MDSQTCPARLILSRVGERWTMAACRHIALGVVKFTDLKASLPGVSAKVLSETLVRLERDGLITRMIVSGRPPSVTYSLTPLGKSLLEAVGTIVDWSAEHAALIEDARRAYDERRLETDPARRSILTVAH
ncbi:winged helix-turn-helix transcriptional regulator [Streptomyces sp. O3]